MAGCLQSFRRGKLAGQCDGVEQGRDVTRQCIQEICGEQYAVTNLTCATTGTIAEEVRNT